MTRPFSTIQPPEEIAKAYNGDKQKIAAAMQMGIVDPTAGVLAGMFIDRMRAAQAQEGRNPPTVAQQVMGGLPPPPPVPPLPAGGVGSLSPAGLPSMAPSMGYTPTPEVGAPPASSMPMADGGLAALPVPDTLFDEPDNGSYAGGGIVAFADGGIALGPWIEETAVKAIPGIVVTSRQRTPEKNRAVGGVPNSYHLTNNARDFVPPKGMDMRTLAAELKALYGSDYDVINEGDHIHVEPSRTNRYLSSGLHIAPDYMNKVINTIPPDAVHSKVPSFDKLSTPRPDILSSAEKFRKVLMDNASPETKRREQMIAELEAAIDPETRKAEREKRRWEALAQFGFQLAQSPGSLLQAASTAALNTLPMLREGDEQARKELRADLTALAQLEKLSNDEKREIELLALELAKAEAGLISGERKLELDYIISKMGDATQRLIYLVKSVIDSDTARLQAQTNIDVANIQADARERQAKATANFLGLNSTGGEDVIDFSRLK